MNTSIFVDPIPAFRDNYIWAIHNQRHAIVIDPGDARAVRAFLAQHNLTLCAILTTHHHHDHTGGNAELAEAFGIPVYGPAKEAIPALSHPLSDGDTVHIPELALQCRVLDIPGHTAGHIALYGHGWLFCGDTLFGCGCGRLFEGTAAQMFASLEKLAALPADTLVFCAHEYTLDNIAFALSLEPDNPALLSRAQHDRERVAAHQPTLPSTLALEKATNPFLRCREPALHRYAEYSSGKSIHNPVEVFSILRTLKNDF